MFNIYNLQRRTLTSWELNANVEKITELQDQIKIKEDLLSKFKDQIQDGKKTLQQYDSQLVNLNSLKDSRDVVKYLLNHVSKIFDVFIIYCYLCHCFFLTNT